ncbi:DUF4382 domain-containing protein [Fulvivirga lutimaris]|uniref:DUF4382 domain-containing protein n=1 Tax=Fulvivirga lutimaris TaxID=1819566 RepID=UPI0012BD3EB7|nr:DUF4382 domain-containing protein [Fulvivirga lutimaris]MTI38013.1 DUF4382 domain-containing protein [Fulvivirga lutimaris]
MKLLNKLLVILFASSLLFACGDDNEAAKGRVSVSITDAPIDDANVSAVFISINSVELKGPDGWTTLDSFEEPVSIDLLSYQNGEVYFLTDEVIDAGSYSEVRLMLDIQDKINGVQQNEGCYIEYKDGSTQPLLVPSGGRSGYKAKGEFDIVSGGAVALTLDFDVRKAVVEAGSSGKFILKPTIRLIANQDASMITGTFDQEDGDFSKVIVFAYEDDTFTDSEMDEPGDEEVRFANAVTSNTVTEEGAFTLAFMESGTYDLYFASYDENGEFIELIGSSNDVEVEAGINLSLDISLSLLN